LTDML